MSSAEEGRPKGRGMGTLSEVSVLGPRQWECPYCHGFHRPDRPHASDYECPACGYKIPFNRSTCRGCGESVSMPSSFRQSEDELEYGDYPEGDAEDTDEER